MPAKDEYLIILDFFPHGKPGDKRAEPLAQGIGQDFFNLLTYAKDLLEKVVEEIIDKNEKRFVEFFNRAGPLTTRLHSLELLPGIGKKHMWEIIRERKKKPFENFDDLQKRVPMLPNPKKMIVRRIIEELQNRDRHRLFIAR